MALSDSTDFSQMGGLAAAAFTMQPMTGIEEILNRLSLSVDRIANFASNAIYGQNFNPNVHTSLGAGLNMLAMSPLGGVLGMNDPRVFTQAVQGIAMNTYGVNSPMAPIQSLYVGNAINRYNSLNMTDAARKENPYLNNVSNNDIAAAAYYLNQSGQLTFDDINALNTGGLDGKVATDVMDRALETISVCKNILKMGDDIAAQISTVNIIGGSHDFQTSSKNFLNYVNSAVAHGMGVQERQNFIDNTIKLTAAYRQQGFSQQASADMARTAMGGFLVGKDMRSKGIEFDDISAANLYGNVLADEAISDDMYYTNVAIRAARVLSDDERQAFYDKLSNAKTPEERYKVFKAQMDSNSRFATEAKGVFGTTQHDRKGIVKVMTPEEQTMSSDMLRQRVSATYEDAMLEKLKEVGEGYEGRQEYLDIMEKLRKGAHKLSDEDMAVIRRFNAENAVSGWLISNKKAYSKQLAVKREALAADIGEPASVLQLEGDLHDALANDPFIGKFRSYDDQELVDQFAKANDISTDRAKEILKMLGESGHQGLVYRNKNGGALNLGSDGYMRFLDQETVEELEKKKKEEREKTKEGNNYDDAIEALLNKVKEFLKNELGFEPGMLKDFIESALALIKKFNTAI